MSGWCMFGGHMSGGFTFGNRESGVKLLWSCGGGVEVA